MQIYILKISSKNAETLSAYRDRDDAMIALHDYVCAEWDEGLTEQYGDIETLTHDDAIDAYFDAWGQAIDPEYYTITEVELQDRLLNSVERGEIDGNE